jgi:hypothetical protein
MGSPAEQGHRRVGRGGPRGAWVRTLAGWSPACRHHPHMTPFARSLSSSR